MPNITHQSGANRKTPDSPIGRIMIRFVALAVIYLILIFLLPGNKQFMDQHSLGLGEYHILQLLVGFPLIVIWLVAFYGYAKLEEYTRSIRKTAEFSAFSRLTQGCAWIAWSLPIYAIVGLIGSSLANAHPTVLPAEVIIVNYIDLLFPLVGFTLMGMASREFFERAKLSLSAANIRAVTLLFVAGGVLYCYLVFRQFSGYGLGSANNPFHLPVWLTVLTVIVPYLYAWFVGLLAVYELIVYGRKVRGVLYRQAFQMLVIGLLLMILGSVAFQYSRSTQFAATGTHLFLGTYFVFNLFFQIISGVGFILIALGAGRLKKIEEV